MRAAAKRFHRVLSESVRRRVANVAGGVANVAGKCAKSRVGVLFSGGLDSLVSW